MEAEFASIIYCVIMVNSPRVILLCNAEREKTAFAVLSLAEVPPRLAYMPYISMQTTARSHAIQNIGLWSCLFRYKATLLRLDCHLFPLRGRQTCAHTYRVVQRLDA